MRPPPLHEGLQRVERIGNQRFPDQPDAEEESQHVNQHHGPHGMMLQIMKHVMTQLMPSRGRRIVLQRTVGSGSRHFRHRVVGRQQHRTQGGPIITIKGLMTDGNAEEPGKPERFIRALRFDVPTKRFRSHVNTEHELRSRPRIQGRHRPLMGREFVDDVGPKDVFIRLKPHRAMLILGKSIQPSQQRSRLGHGKVLQVERREFQTLGQMKQAPGVPADGRYHGLTRMSAVSEPTLIVIRPVLPIRNQRGQGSVNPPFPSADDPRQFRLIQHAHRQILNRINGMVALRVIRGIDLKPTNEPRPPR